MAAGLPCLVSDWDGYRDTVVDGETGIRIPTWMPAPGMGAAIADAYSADNLTYDLYVGYASQMTAVEVPAFADALVAMARDPGLRRRLGEAGRRRARALYDWRVVVPAYQDLWSELAARRQADVELAPPRWQVRNPRLSDPFDVFAGHGRALKDDMRVRLDPDGPDVDTVAADPGNTFAANGLLARDETDIILRLLQGGERSIAECLQALPLARRVRGIRSLGWLIKYGVLSLTDNEGAV
jgi:hypothetical protein